jgi:hypothetical protein
MRIQTAVYAITKWRFRMRPDTRVVSTDCSSWRLNVSPLLTLAICVFMSGCWGSRDIWFAESRSPDGKVLAKARAVATNGGLSIQSITHTEVYLKWTTGSSTDAMVLGLADASDAPVDTQLEMNWLTPSHLVLTFRGNQTVVFQAIRWFGIDISLHDLSKTTDKGNAIKSPVPTPPAFAYRKQR